MGYPQPSPYSFVPRGRSRDQTVLKRSYQQINLQRLGAETIDHGPETSVVLFPRGFPSSLHDELVSLFRKAS